MTRYFTFGLSLFSILACSIAQAESKPVQVFVLAGQSNMEGKAAVTTLDAVIEDSTTAEKYKHLKDGNGWAKRDDVFVTFLDRGTSELAPGHGPLSVGFGSPRRIRDKEGNRINVAGVGPELGIGWTLGEKIDAPVLLIKAAWGGRAVKHTFRPPSAMPSEEELKERLAQIQKKNPEMTFDKLRENYGSDYRAILSEVRKVLENIEEYVPNYDEADGYELAGFIWFQGFNDMVGGGNPDYTEQLAHFIRDMRRDLKKPELPFVIGELGTGGENANEGMATFRNQQRAVAEFPEFKGNVAFAPTAHLYPVEPNMDDKWDSFKKLAQANERKPTDDPTRVDPGAFYQKNWEQKHYDQLRYTSDRPYHYRGSGACYYDMGVSMGQASIRLLDDME